MKRCDIAYKYSAFDNNTLILFLFKVKQKEKSLQLAHLKLCFFYILRKVPSFFVSKYISLKKFFVKVFSNLDKYDIIIIKYKYTNLGD